MMGAMPQEYVLDLVRTSVAPVDNPFEERISSRGGRTLPFKVLRSWSGPAGTYIEQWSIRRGGAEVLYRHSAQLITVRGMQSVSDFTDTVTEPIELEPGTYKLVFIVEGRFMGAVDIEVKETADQAA
jgi:hypothetical protein